MKRGKPRNPNIVFLLMVLTCGLYALYWGYTVSRELNAALGREEINPKRELALTLLTFGIWGNVFLQRLAKATLELQRAWNVQSTTDMLSLLYFGPFSIQGALNSVWWWGTPLGAGDGTAIAEVSASPRAEAISAPGAPLERGKTRDPATVFLLMLATGSVYTFYWSYAVAQEINAGLGHQRLNAGREVALSILIIGLIIGTCFIYFQWPLAAALSLLPFWSWFFYFQWRLSRIIPELEQVWGLPARPDMLSFYLLGPITAQDALNNVWENGTPGGDGDSDGADNGG